MGASHHTIFIMNDGSAKALGYNIYVQLGIGSTANKSAPVDVIINN